MIVHVFSRQNVLDYHTNRWWSGQLYAAFLSTDTVANK